MATSWLSREQALGSFCPGCGVAREAGVLYVFVIHCDVLRRWASKINNSLALPVKGLQT